MTKLDPEIFVDAIKPHLRLLVKPIENCLTEGCHMDVWVPEKDVEGAPIGIFIHGGGFSVGSSRDIGFNQVKWCLERGIAAVSLEYRLMPHVTHPEIRQDILDAYLYLQNQLNSELAAKGYKTTVDPSRCFVTGGSAGGTSALYLAADVEIYNKSHKTDPIPPIRAVISAFPLVDPNDKPCPPMSDFVKAKQDLTEEEYEKMINLKNEPVCVSDPYPQDVFARPTSPRSMWSRYSVTLGVAKAFLYDHDPPFPPEEVLTTYATPSYPPTTLWCAVKDTLIPVAHSYMMVDALEKQGVEVRRVDVEAEHGFSDLPARYFPEEAPKWWKEAIKPTLEWAETKLKA